MGYLKKNNLITEDEFYILNTLEENGYRARIVGGAVRNFLLNKPIKDIDIATSATLQQVTSVFAKTNIPIIPIGERYGTVMLRYRDKSYEITTLREDVRSFGRQAEVRFTDSFEIDSFRRDFTINALYMDKSGELFDYHNGLRDIFSKNIRFIGNAYTRIQEDYLRVFRYFRFVSQYGEYKVNCDYLEIIHELKDKLFTLSSERILNELLNIFSSDDSYRIVKPMSDIFQTLFATYENPLAVCHEIGIFQKLSPVERLGMILKFSDYNKVTKFHWTKHINSIISMKDTDITDIKKQLKLTATRLQNFYAKYIVISNVINNTINKAKAIQLVNELETYTANHMSLFPLRAGHLSHLQLQKQQLASTIIKTKKFWLTHDEATLEDCIGFATNNRPHSTEN